MAEQMETVEYLCGEVGARPTGTEEEQLAALYIAEKMREDAGLSAIVEDFNCPSNPHIVKLICFGVAILAAILSIVLPGLNIIWTLLTIVMAVIYVLENRGKAIISKIFKSGISQNVVAKYQPEGMSGSRNRKIVLVASYDSGKDANGMAKGPIAEKTPLLQKICLGGLIASAVFLLLRTIFFASATGGIAVFFSVIAVICIIIMALPIIGIILEQRAPFSEGANNNAAGVSVLLDVAAAVGSGKLAEDQMADETMIEGEEAAYAADVVPEGAELEYEAQPTATPVAAPSYEPAQRAMTPEESLAAAKAAIAAMTGKPVADKVPFTDISTHLVHGDGFDDYNTPVNVRFEVADEPTPIVHQTYFGEADYAAAAAQDEVRAASTPRTPRQAVEAQAMAAQAEAENAATAEAVAQLENVQPEAAQPEAQPVVSENFTRQAPSEYISAEPATNEDLNPSIPAWARSARSKARANRPDLANTTPNVARSRYADTVAARIVDEAISGNTSNTGTFSSAAVNGAVENEQPQQPQTELQARLAAMRNEIESAAAPYTEKTKAAQADSADQAPAIQTHTASAFVEDQTNEPAIAKPTVAEPEAPAAPMGAFVNEPVRVRVVNPAASQQAAEATQDESPAEFVAPAAQEPELDEPISEATTAAFSVVDVQNAAQAEADEMDAAEDIAIDDAFAAAETPATPRRRTSVRGAQPAEAAGVMGSVSAFAGKASSFASGFAKSIKEKASSINLPKIEEEEPVEDVETIEAAADMAETVEQAPKAFTLRDASKASRVPVGGPVLDDEELIESTVDPGKTDSLSPMDVSAYLNDVEYDDFDDVEQIADEEYADYDESYVEEYVEPRMTAAQLNEEVARKIADEATEAISLEDIMSAVKQEMAAEGANATRRTSASAPANVLNLPNITGSVAVANGEPARKPIDLPGFTEADEQYSEAPATPSALVSSMIPRITTDGTPDAAGVQAVADFNGTSPEAYEAYDEQPEYTEDAAGQTQAFTPEPYTDEPYTDQDEFDSFMGQGAAQPEKKGFFSRLFGKKKQEEETGVAEWVGADEDYVAQEVGRQRGNWESFQQEDVSAEPDYYAPAQEEFIPEDDGFMPIENNDGFVPVDNSGFAEINYSDDFDSFHNPRDWNGGGLSLDRLKSLKDKAPSLPGRKNKDAEEEAPSEGRRRSTRGGSTRAGRVPRETRAIEGELNKINTFHAGGLNAEVWFVALGSTIPNNAGMKAFLDEHGDELQGATIINLEALGAGSLSFIQHEGRLRGVNTTSRFKRNLRQASERSGVSFSNGKLDGIDTPATIAIRRGFKAMSLVGMDRGKKALGTTELDTMENLDPQVMRDNAAFVIGLLKSL